MKRRDALRLTLAAAGSGLLSNRVPAQSPELLKYLCPPDGVSPDRGDLTVSRRGLPIMRDTESRFWCAGITRCRR